MGHSYAPGSMALNRNGGGGGVSSAQAEPEALEELMSSLNDFTPLLPDEVTRFYLERSGFHAEDSRLVRLVSLSVHKFLADVSSDCVQLARMQQNIPASRERDRDRDRERERQTVAAPAQGMQEQDASGNEAPGSAAASASPAAAAAGAGTASKSDRKGGSLTLTNSVLGRVLREYGITLRKPLLYADTPASAPQSHESTK